MIVDVYIEGQRLDLYDDEQITIRSNVQDINDISKLYADFSQSFTVPASKTNNAIFKHYYNADINNGYDARTRKDAVVYVNTLDFKRGKVRLDSVSIKHNQIVDYKITFFGDVIKIKDDIGNDKLKDLTWLSNFDHDITDTNIKAGLEDGLDFTVDSVTYNDAIIYPMISYKKQWYYNSDVSDGTNTDTLVNIHYNNPEQSGIDYRNLKPAIKLSLLVKAIEEEYGFTFNSPFFNSVQFSNIYMNLHNSTDSVAIGSLVVEERSANTGGEGSLSNDEIRYQITVTPVQLVPYYIKLYINDQIVYENNNGLVGEWTKKGYLDNFPDACEFRAEVWSEFDMDFDATTQADVVNTAFDIVYANIFTATNYTGLSIEVEARIRDMLPDVKVYDFLTSLFKMFNLIVRPDGTDIYIDDLQSWYSNGQIYDITKFVDTSTEKVKRGKIYKEIDFTFEESEQILAKQYQEANAYKYGDLNFKLADEDDLSDIDGDTLEIEVLFENPIHERLADTNTSQLTAIQYTPFINKSLEQFVGKPFLFYAINTEIETVGLIGSGINYYAITNAFLPSHSIELDYNSFNLNFNAVVNEYSYYPFSDTIYNRYYRDYITDMFSIKRRIYDFEAKLPYNLLNVLKLNDRLIIKDRRYIINSITHDLTTRKDTLELINDIYDAPLVSDVLNTSLWQRSEIGTDGNSKTISNTYIGLSGKNITFIDNGYGTTWITADVSKTDADVDNINFDIDENLTGTNRTVNVKVTDGLNDPEFTVAQVGKQIAALDFSNSNNTVNYNLLTGIV